MALSICLQNLISSWIPIIPLSDMKVCEKSKSEKDVIDKDKLKRFLFSIRPCDT